MKVFLTDFVGKKVEIMCAGGVGIRGEINAVKDDVLQVTDEQENVCYIAIDKITLVRDAKEIPHRVGFKGGFAGKSQ